MKKTILAVALSTCTFGANAETISYSDQLPLDAHMATTEINQSLSLTAI